MPRARGPNYEQNTSYPSTAPKNKTAALPSNNALSDAKQRKIELECRQLEIKNAILLEEYVTLDEISRVTGEIFNIIRQRLIALPSKITPQIAPELDPNVIEMTLRDEINDMLSELSAFDTYKSTADAKVKTTKSTAKVIKKTPKQPK